MTCENMNISAASENDLSDILSLLSDVDLPHDGVVQHLSGFLVARDRDGRMAGTIGLERHGQVGLLRSVAVAPNLQRSGLGSCLTSTLLEQAAAEKLEKIVLLTTTARDYFARRFGFAESDRSIFDNQLADSSEWSLPRCSSAVCMSLELNKKRTSSGSEATD